MAKVAVLMPILFAVIVTMLVTLGALDRLPNLGLDTYAHLTVSLMALAVAALALGLLASAAVSDPAQATLALPMLCFPAVLFAGAVLPVDDMALAAVRSASSCRPGGATRRCCTISGWAAARASPLSACSPRCSSSRRTRAQPEELTTALVWRATIRFSSLTTTCTSNGRR